MSEGQSIEEVKRGPRYYVNSAAYANMRRYSRQLGPAAQANTSCAAANTHNDTRSDTNTSKNCVKH
jgi:phage terminase small subunit